MNNTKLILKNIISFIIIITVLILFAHIFVFLLPIIIFLVIGYYLYKLFFKDKVKFFKREKENYKDEIKEALVIDEKFDE